MNNIGKQFWFIRPCAVLLTCCLILRRQNLSLCGSLGAICPHIVDPYREYPSVAQFLEKFFDVGNIVGKLRIKGQLFQLTP
jgi:hypothetical protein